MGRFQTLLSACGRTKVFNPDFPQDSLSKRTLGLVDLLAIGLSTGLGLGGYVLMPYVAKEHAGPSAVLSFLFAGVTALMGVLCYAECSVRFPRGGAVYLYAYVTMGESIAFAVGWTLILEYVLICAITGKTWGQYLDFLAHGNIIPVFRGAMPLNLGPQFEDHVDITAFIVVMVSTCLAAVLAKALSVSNCILTVLGFLISIAIICVGLFHVESENWRKPPGFFPFGLTGTVHGAAMCFAVFIGVDIIVNLAEECKEPSKILPKALTTAFILVFVSCFGLTLALTLTYFWKDYDIYVTMPKAFSARGITGSNYVIGIGGVISLLTSTVCVLFGAPRLVKAMSSDGLLVSVLSREFNENRNPIVSTVCIGMSSAGVALLLNSVFIIEMLSIGTLVSFLMVSVCTLLLKYSPFCMGLHREYDWIADSGSTEFARTSQSGNTEAKSSRKETHSPDNTPVQEEREEVRCTVLKSELETAECRTRKYPSTKDGQSNYSRLADDLISCDPNRPILDRSDSVNQRFYVMVKSDTTGSFSSLLTTTSEVSAPPSFESYRTVKAALLIFTFAATCLGILTIHGRVYVANADWWAVVFLCLFLLSMCASVFFIAKQPRNHTSLIYASPYIPFVPLTAIILNLYMLVSLSGLAWIRFATWIGLGLLVYLVFGIRKSKARTTDEEEVILYDVTDRTEE